MTQDPASLESLRDIVEAPPVSWWPMAPGWWVVLAVVAVTMLVVSWRAWKNWQASAYRRAALRELQTATTVAEITQLLKRTALSAWPRTEVASLTGAAWCDWLQQTGSADVPKSVARMLSEGAWSTETPDVHPLSVFAAAWIRDHKVQEANPC